jgi:CRP-like cAMP-binding protein
MNSPRPWPSIENRILATLPAAEREPLLAHLEPFTLDHSVVLYEIGDRIEYVYFVNSGMVSLISITEDGDLLEVGIIGYEGLVGLSVFLETTASQYRTLVQSTGEAFKMKADIFTAECDHRPALRSLIRRYTHARMTQIIQAAVCNRFHSLEARLCRWLLQSQDIVKSNELELTQDFLAMMLGVHRPGVSMVAGTLQNAGLIRYSRGHITILDRQRLEASSCECYKIIRQAIEGVAKT